MAFIKQLLTPAIALGITSEYILILGKEYVKAVYCHSAYLTFVQSTSYEIPGWIKHKLESRLLEDTSIISPLQMIPPLWKKAKKN